MIRKVGIAGGGHMGSDLFGLFSKDLDVVMWVRRAEAAEALDKEHLAPLRRRAEKAGERGDAARQRLARLKITTDLEELADVDMVSESIVEDVALKRDLLGKLSRIVSPGAILTSNSSYTIPSEMADACTHPERFAGLHFFFPSKFVPFLEIIPHPGTSAATVEALFGLAQTLEKRPFLVRLEVPGFFVNRIIGPFFTEGVHLLGEGYYRASAIDGLVRGKLTMRGPVEGADQIGTDVMYTGEMRFPHEKRPGDYMPRLLPWLNERGRYGVKAGAGCYLYDGGQALDDPNLPRLFGPEGDPGPYTDQDVFDRIWYGLVAEAYRILDKGIASAEDIEYGLKQVLGIEEGPFTFVGRIGREVAQARMAELTARFGPRFEARGSLA